MLKKVKRNKFKKKEKYISIKYEPITIDDLYDISVPNKFSKNIPFLLEVLEVDKDVLLYIYKFEKEIQFHDRCERIVERIGEVLALSRDDIIMEMGNGVTTKGRELFGDDGYSWLLKDDPTDKRKAKYIIKMQNLLIGRTICKFLNINHCEMDETISILIKNQHPNPFKKVIL